MKDRKIVIDGLTTQDFEVMESNFRNMANKGLLIEKIKFGVSFYKRIQAKDIQFAIGIYPKPKVYEKPEAKVVADYIQAQEEKGWKHLFSQEYTHVFINENDEEIEAIDKIEQVDNIKATLKLEIISFTILILLNIYNMTRMSGIEIYNLSSNLGLISIFIMPVITIVIVSYIIYDIFRYIKIKNKNSNDELQIKNVTMVKIFRKISFIFTLLFMGLFIVAIIADSFISGSRIIFIFLPMTVALFVGFKLRGFFMGRNLAAVAKTIIVSLVIFFVISITSVIAFSLVNDGFGKELPQKYIALKLEDIGIERKSEDIIFRKEGSILMPLKYSYTEHSDLRWDSSKYVSTQAEKALNKELADYIFDLELENSLRYYGKLLSAKEYYADYDNAVFLQHSVRGTDEVFLQRGKYVFSFSGDFDLQEASSIDLINDMVDKIITSLN